MQAQHSKIPDTPVLLARRMAALDLDLAAVARSEPAVFRDLRDLCAKCRSLDRCERDMLSDPAGSMRYCPNNGLLNFLTDMWWLKTLL
jgi:hypothetical protein